MKTFLISLKLFSQYFLTNSSLIRVFILYCSIGLAIIYYFKIHEAIGLIGFLKICLPTLFVIPAIKMTLLNNEVVANFFQKLKHYNCIDPKILLVSHITIALIISLLISLPTFTYDYYEFLMNYLSFDELLFEFIKYMNLLLFFVLISFSVKIEDDMNNMNIIIGVFSLNIFLTFGVFIIDELTNKYLFIDYFGGYFGTHVFAKLSLSRLVPDKGKDLIFRTDNPLIFGMPNDLFLTIILALMSLWVLFSLMFYGNDKYVRKYNEARHNDLKD